MLPPFVSADQLPQTLWDDAPAGSPRNHPKVMRLPELLREAYVEMLEELDLKSDAEKRTPNDEGAQGGRTQEETLKHFSRNFSGSCARIQFVAMDPKEIFKTTRDAFVRMFCGGHLSLLDIPCGAGAAGATLLCLAAELRQQGILPRQPLIVNVVGGDISKPAQKLKRTLYRKLAKKLKGLGIRVAPTVLDWNVEDEDQTSTLIHRWSKTSNPRATTFALAVNFSGFLHKKVKDCKGPLGEVFRHAKAQNATFFWVEPATSAALKNLFPTLENYVFSKVPKVRPQRSDKPRTGEALSVHPVQGGGSFVTRCAAVHFETEKAQP